MDFAYAKNFRAGFIFTADGARMNSINACLIVVVRINAKQNGGLILFSIPLKFQNGTRSKDFENLFRSLIAVIIIITTNAKQNGGLILLFPFCPIRK